MEMSNDKAIESLQILKNSWEVSLRNSLNETEREIDQDIVESLAAAIDTIRKYQQLEEFARWVAIEVIDEDMWTLNHLAFAELACRKLVKLGIVQESNGEYLYEVIEDGKID